MRRVVITGIGFCSPIGNTLQEVKSNFEQMKSGIRYMHEWDDVNGLDSRIAGVVDKDDFSEIPRNYRRTMDRVSMMSALSLQEAIKQSGLTQEQISSLRTGLSFGSAMGGLETLFSYAKNVANINYLDNYKLLKNDFR